MPFCLRQPTEEDREDFLRMNAAFYRSDAVDHEIDPAFAAKTFDAFLNHSPFIDMLVAERDDGQLLGYCLLALTWSNEAGGPTAWIDEIYVTPEARGQHVGAAMMHEIHITYTGMRRFRLEVTPRNERAREFHKRFGYEPLEYQQMTRDFPFTLF